MKYITSFIDWNLSHRHQTGPAYEAKLQNWKEVFLYIFFIYTVNRMYWIKYTYFTSHADWASRGTLNILWKTFETFFHWIEFRYMNCRSLSHSLLCYDVLILFLFSIKCLLQKKKCFPISSIPANQCNPHEKLTCIIDSRSEDGIFEFFSHKSFLPIESLYLFAKKSGKTSQIVWDCLQFKT